MSHQRPPSDRVLSDLGIRKDQAYRAAITLVESTIKDVIRDLKSEIGMMLHTSQTPYHESGTIRSLLQIDVKRSPYREIFRSPHTPAYLVQALELGSLDELAAILEVALERAIDEPVKLRVVSVGSAREDLCLSLRT